MMSQAVQIKQNQDQLRMKSLTDISDMMYKSALSKQALANAEHLARPEPEDEPSGIMYNGNQLSWRELKAFPPNDRSYLIYKQGAINQGTDIMDQSEWETLKPTEQEKLLRSVMKDPKLKSVWLEGKKAGATKLSIGEKLEQARLTDLGKASRAGEIDYLSGDYTKRLDKYMNSEAVQNQILFGDTGGKYTPKQIETGIKLDWIEKDIKAKGGKIIGEPKISEDGRSMIFTVKWPESDINREVRHDIN